MSSTPAAASPPPCPRPAPSLRPSAVRSGSGSRRVLLAKGFQPLGLRRSGLPRGESGLRGAMGGREEVGGYAIGRGGARASLTWPFSSLSPGWRPRRRGAIALRAPFSPVGGPHALASRCKIRRLGDTTPTIKARLAWSRFGVFPFHPALLRRAPGMCDTQTHRQTSQNLN